MRAGRVARRSVLAALGAAACVRPAAAAGPIRVGTLRFGSLAWELDVLRHHAMLPPGAIEAMEFATGPASQTALQAGSVDVVLQDWIWTSRLRSEGAPWTFAPASAALGAIVVPEGSALRELTDLPGRRLGVAGGPLDKSWLLLRVFARPRAGLDLDAAVEKAFGPPPLLAAQLEAGRLDAVLTYWPFVARAEAQGRRVLLEMSDVLTGLDLPAGLPILGYVFAEPWAERNREPLTAFLRAAAAARALLMTSDAEWERIAPLTGASTPAELARLRERYRRGDIRPWDPATLEAAERLFALLAAIGGPALVGSGQHLAPGTFWRAA